MKVLYCFPGGRFKALTMSYDDGNVADRRLVSIFNRYGIKGTFNLNYGLMKEGIQERVGLDEVKELYQGHEVATHTAYHPTIGRCPLTYVAEEIKTDREGLEELTGYVVRGHAYPNESYSKEIEELFKMMGIAYGRVGIVYGRKGPREPDFALPINPMEWRPTCHHKDPNLMEYGQYLIDFKASQYLKLMYVYGHSYEFDRAGNWHVIEDFCKLIGGKKDIWYATNIEIIDYMEVLNRLRFTAKCDGVYNPSAASAWLCVGSPSLTAGKGTIIEAKGGCFTSFKNAEDTAADLF